MRKLPDGLGVLFSTLGEHEVQILHIDSTALEWLRKRAHKYRDLAPQVADLSLLYLAEQHSVRTVFTFDRRDFAVFRTSDGRSLELLPDRR